jgi:hypothetical protein
VREYFKENGIYYEPAIIEGELQEAVEGRYIQHLRKLGVTSEKLTKESGAKRYFVLFDWVCRDFPNREKFVKTGFPSWKRRWRQVAMRRCEKYRTNKDLIREQIKKRADEICALMSESSNSIRKGLSEN